MRRPSTRLFIAGAALAIVACSCEAYLRKVRREFSAPTTITMGTVVKKGALLDRPRRSNREWFCWVSYEFTPRDGARRRNWRLWQPACGVSPGGEIPVQHVVANPDVNRPAGGGEPWIPAGLFFFATGVTVVIAVIVRRSEKSAKPHDRMTQ